MADLDIGWSTSTPFPAQPLAEADLNAHLAQARGELLDWNDPRRARLGFAMSAPAPIAVDTLLDFLPLNSNNVGHHARFGEGKTGTRRLEKEALAALGGLLHGGALDGYLTSGATEATIASLRIARNALRAAGAKRIRVLSGELCHQSVPKAAEILDLDFHPISTGPTWVVEIEDFNTALDMTVGDGCGGVIVVATAGYYNSGLCDPIAAMADHLRQAALASRGRFSVYLHVDAAHGGLIFPFTNRELAFDFRNPGVHAIAVDPHKSGQMPYSCGVLLTRKGLFDHVTRVDRNTAIADETLLGSRSGAMAAALWAVLHSLGSAGYTAIVNDCLRKRDALRNAITTADPTAEIVSPTDAPVVSAAFSIGLLPAQLCEDYRLVPMSLPSRHGGRQPFYHFYAGASLTPQQIGRFAESLSAAVSAGRDPDEEAAATSGPEHEVVAAVRGETDCFRHFVVHPRGRRDPSAAGYSFHTFDMRRSTGEPLTCRQHRDARAGGPLYVFAPDLGRPFANELFGVATARYSLEILDRHQQELSLVGASHASVPLPDRDMRVLLNFEANGRLRSLEYKLLGDELTDEIQIFVDRTVFKIGKSSAGFRRPRSRDYSFSIDTSAEIRIDIVDSSDPPAVSLAGYHSDVLLPRRRHLRREQFRRFPNRFFDVEVDLTVGRAWKGHTELVAVNGLRALPRPLLVRSADLGPCELFVDLGDGGATVTVAGLTGTGEPRRTLRANWQSVPIVFAAMPVLDVREPERLTVDQVVAYAEAVYGCLVLHSLPAALPNGFAVGGEVE